MFAILAENYNLIYNMVMSYFSLGFIRMSLPVFKLKRVKFPRPGCAVGLSVGADVVCGFVFGFQLRFAFRCPVMLGHVVVGICKDFRVVLLLGRLILLVRFFASTVKLFTITDVEVALVLLLELAMNLIDG